MTVYEEGVLRVIKIALNDGVYTSGKNGLNELTGSLPVPETWTSQGTELEHAMLGKQQQGLFLAHLTAHLIFLGSEENQIFLYRESLCL